MAMELAIHEEEAPARPQRRLPHANGAAGLSRREKAAIVVRLLLAEGARLPLTELPEALQAELTTQISRMTFVDRQTLREVVEEFATELDSIGLSFPGGLEGALQLLEGAISPDMAARLRQQSGALWENDPWPSISEFDVARLRELLGAESPEIGAVILSKLDVGKAAELLNALPGPEARRLTLAVSETANIAPEAVKRIGVALAAELRAEPPRAFGADAANRLGAILDVSSTPTREDILAGLAEEDEALAARVRAAIFTFADIPERVETRDVPVLSREIPQDTLVDALASAGDGPQLAASADFLLENLPGRLASSLRDAVEERGTPEPEVAERARIEVIRSIRRLADEGTITLKVRAAE